MLPKILRVAFSVYVLRKPVVRQAAIAITYECPCSCEFCSAHNIKQNCKPAMTTAEIENLIDDFAKLGCLSICFSGGEPLSHPDILRMVRRVRDKKMLCSIITSCATYSETLWEELKIAGVNTLYLSVDGIGTRHDTFRGIPGLFGKVEKAMAKARELKIEFYFNGVVTNDNIADRSLYEIIDYCQMHDVKIFILSTSATGRVSDPKFLLTDENLIEFDRIRKMPNVIWEGDTTLTKIGCPAGIQVVFISGFGDILPCPFIEISFGNIREISLKEAVEKMWSYDIFGNVTPVCLMGADKRFYNEWLLPLKDAMLPQNIEDHPLYTCKNWSQSECRCTSKGEKPSMQETGHKAS
jgi:MoaA/NifB/PqqE/SkfB family radical SAM enzyme